MSETYLFHTVTQQGFHALNERLQRLLGFFRAFIYLIRQLVDGLIGFCNRLERFTVELGQVVHHPLVDAVRQQQHFDAFLAQQLQVRAALRRRVAVGGDVVDLLLPFFHAGDILFQRHGLRGGVGVRGGEAQQLSNGFNVCGVFCRAFLQHQAKLFPEGLVFFRIVFRQFFQHL